MEFRKKGFFSTAAIYAGAGRDFPRSERKPLAVVLFYYLTGRCRCYTLEEKGPPAAYAIVFSPKNARVSLVDYLAVEPAHRGQGLGSRLLGHLCEAEGALVLEAENPAYGETPEACAVMERRIAFYQRAGFVRCPYEVRLFGVEFSILSRPGSCPRKTLEEIYRNMMPPAVRKKQLAIRDIG